MPITVDAELLTRTCTVSLQASGVSREHAEDIADSLVLADARGLSSHGVSRMAIYTASIRSGVMDSAAEPEVLRNSPATCLIDGHNGLGVPTAFSAMDLAIDKAEEVGFGFAVVRRSNHFGMAGHIADRAARQGMIGYAATNGPSRMAPFGGAVPVFGTSPFAYAIPTGGKRPILIDMATCVVARGKIIMAERAGEEIPEGWAVDSEGRTTTDPAAALAGAVLPFAGPKGSALAMLVEILTGVLGGDVWGQGVGDMYQQNGRPSGTSHCVAALDVETMIGHQEFDNNLADLISQMKLSPRSTENEVFLPGERELLAQEKALREGILLADDVVAELNELFDSQGIAPLGPRTAVS